jgi:hypothetical protein
MSRPLPDEITEALPPQAADMIRDILRDLGSLSRLMELYYLACEPGMIDILRGLATLSDDDRCRLRDYLNYPRARPLRVHERAGILSLEDGEIIADKAARAG